MDSVINRRGKKKSRKQTDCKCDNCHFNFRNRYIFRSEMTGTLSGILFLGNAACQEAFITPMVEGERSITNEADNVLM